MIQNPQNGGGAIPRKQKGRECGGRLAAKKDMEKKATKLGISTFLLAAIIYLFGMFGGLVATTLAVGYVLICEKDRWLKSSALKALLIAVCFLLIDQLINFIPMTLGLIESLINIFDGYFNYSIILKLQSFLDGVFNYIRYIVFLALAFMALGGKTFSLPFVDNLIAKHSTANSEN